MITIKNKFILVAAGFWISGIILILAGAWAKSSRPDMAGILLSGGILAQALGFGFLGFAIMQAVMKKK
ncbi:hypothetical protein [Spirosoma foliorum]|uniref:Uncharacterized protein n=1 Tax=Spirosoma foliorum TaxID=2710596 RepID=A0A7G5GSX1_9BACT|nr:hypothetical protein [Spirosoma foliorum]QMW01963.1 hypothetical protein H3H32_29140 [Spirosoma foliorum]